MKQRVSVAAVTSWDLGALGDHSRRPACTPKSTTPIGDSVSAVPVSAQDGGPGRKQGPWRPEAWPQRASTMLAG